MGSFLELEALARDFRGAWLHRQRAAASMMSGVVGWGSGA